MFGQTFDPADLVTICLLVLLEGVLSIDNAIVLGILAQRVEKEQQKKVLSYGLVGALVFRVIAIGLAAYLLHWDIVKLLGGAYLVYVGGKHLISHSAEKQPGAAAATGHAGFWATVLAIELTDVAFAIDSILAAVALVGAAPSDAPRGAVHPKLWVIVTGGMLGVVLMRFAAVVFIKLLERFPRFNLSAYLLVLVIGLKLVADWLFNSEEHPHRVNFHDLHDPAFWIFWGLTVACFGIGFLPQRKTAETREVEREVDAATRPE